MFKPVGEKSRRDLALEVLQSHAVGDVIEYGEFAEALGLSSRRVIQSAVRAAGRDYLRVNQHALEAVPNVGYRVVDPDGHVRLADKQRKRSVKTLQRGEALVRSVDYNGMSADTRRVAENMLLGFAHLIEANKRMDGRVASVERVQDAVIQRQERTEAEVEALKARLEKITAAA
jgi:hypothetical protein